MSLVHDLRSTGLAAAGLTVLFLSVFLEPCGAAETTRVIPVMGGSRIHTDLPSAKNAALADCLLSAVEACALDLLPVRTVDENFPAVSEMLSSRYNEFVQNYKILREVKTETHYRLLIQVTVDMDRLEAGLFSIGAAVAPAAMPRVLLLIAEKNADDISFQYGWQAEKGFSSGDAAGEPMKRILYEKGFKIIDPKDIPADSLNDLKLPAEPTEAEALMLGRRLNADVVVYGKARAEETSNRMGEETRSFKSTLDVNALFTATGEGIAPISTSATAADRNASAGGRQALSDAGRQVGPLLAAQILSKWQALKDMAGEIQLNTRGALSNLVAFRNALKDIPGVTGQQTLEMTTDSAVFSVQYRGTPQALADALVLKTFTGFGVNIHEVSENSLGIELTPR